MRKQESNFKKKKKRVTVLHMLRNTQPGFPAGLVIKNPSANARDMSLIPGLGRFPHAGEQASPYTTITESSL